LVASSTSNHDAANGAENNSDRRISFAKISEPLKVPNLLAIQTDSFDRLVGNERWAKRLENAQAAGDTSVPEKSGLAEIFEEISPIRDFQETMQLSFSDPEFSDPKYTMEECKDRDATYAAPLYVKAEFMNLTTGEVKQQTLFMGDFPLMTESGTFVINGTERVVVSQLVRSPGAYFEKAPDRTSDKDIYSARVIPSRGAWFELEIDKRDQVGVRLDRKRKQSVTVLLKALGWTEAKILAEFGNYDSIRATLEKDSVSTRDEALLDIYRKLRPGEPPTVEAAQALLDNMYFTPRRYDLATVGRYKLTKKLGWRRRLLGKVLAHPVVDKETGEIVFPQGEPITQDMVDAVSAEREAALFGEGEIVSFDVQKADGDVHRMLCAPTRDYQFRTVTPVPVALPGSRLTG